MKIKLARLKPAFWGHKDHASSLRKDALNFKALWYRTVFFTSIAAVVPLLFLATIDYNVTKRAAESEIMLRTGRLVSNTRRTISFFLEERKAALDFIAHDYSLEDLRDHRQLASLLAHLKATFGGFSDLGIIDMAGDQIAYWGPFGLEGKNYGIQPWFRNVVEQGYYISDIFLGYRKVPHLVIAVKKPLPDNRFYIIRAAIDTDRFCRILAQMKVEGNGDVFLVNREGILQTPSRFHGDIMGRLDLEIPPQAPATRVYQCRNARGRPLIIGYRYIAGTPLILMVIKEKQRLMSPWHQTKSRIIWFLGFSVFVILLVVTSSATYLVSRLYEADKQRLASLQQMQYANKMASIGRLAAGIAHEINNPLAIIAEKAGLIKDLFQIRGQYQNDRRLLSLADSIMNSVSRCATITRRLLRFARNDDSRPEPAAVGQVVEEVLGFLNKEAQYRGLDIEVDIPDQLPPIVTFRSRLQQILLNIINNAFAAVPDCGTIVIKARDTGSGNIEIQIRDNGAGIAAENIGRIFEPFFSTKTDRGGTGLGLSITYNLVQELGGSIRVESRVGEGTAFTVSLPKKIDSSGENVKNENLACR